MFTMRPATEADTPDVAAMITARCTWMEERGLVSWRENVDDLAGQAGAGFMWVLEAEDRIVGCTTVTTDAPPKDWTPEEAAEESLYLFTTVTNPAYREHKPGTLIALWAVDRAAQQGRRWVRRGCFFPELVKYYETQGFSLVKEQERSAGHLYLLARRAEHLDLAQLRVTENAV
ncbi:GNAT family N-acetyltransferase [Nocardiopsis lambiniae]|uniref:GNAT family N-acetyltransferase n=1 Tax=Nocardiopsis lambiniae TaxID=3075539 RepID=A0ABU2M344_9ACTN|nr:GNAT family N-acetyltransferase [Nocardiopsis sp. DSM 44743]MDT0327055.1 GNAT family N-acetyltransferase [Nocardiopsis sp. DSM 44743]